MSVTKPIHPLKTYGDLTSGERAQIEIQHKAGEGPAGIARLIGRFKSTVSMKFRRLWPVEDCSAAEAGSRRLGSRPFRGD